MRLTCIVEDTVQYNSTLWGEHGLAVLVEADEGNVLWDTGGSATIFEHNVRELGLEDKPIAAIALSHSHNDHTGGLEAALRMYGRVPVIAHSTIFCPRYSKREGKNQSIGMVPSRETVESLGDVRLCDESVEILPSVSTTGGIGNRPYPLGASSRHSIEIDGVMQPDMYLDDQSLVLRVSDGIVLLCGCCHAGLRNTLAAIRETYAEPLVAVAGGTHLIAMDDDEISHIVEALRDEGSPRLYLNHCSGEKAIRRMALAFGDLVQPFQAGAVIEF